MAVGAGNTARPDSPNVVQQRRVLELAGHHRTKPLGFKPLFERAPQRRVDRRQQHRRAVQRPRKSPPQAPRQRLAGEERRPGFTQQVVEDLHADVRGRGRVADHDVERVRGQLGDELFGVAFAARDLNRLGGLGRRTQETVHDQLRDRIRHAHGEPRRPARRPPLERLEQFAAGREDLRGVPVDDAADVGQHERAALALKQTFSERLFQDLDLGADGRLRQPQLLGRLRDAALAHDGPEVQQVVVVEPVHGSAPRCRNITKTSRSAHNYLFVNETAVRLPSIVVSRQGGTHGRMGVSRLSGAMGTLLCPRLAASSGGVLRRSGAPPACCDRQGRSRHGSRRPMT